VGRRPEIEELAALLARARLVTLIGPGGCGKTRLAIGLAAEMAASFAGAVAWADLAPVRDDALVGEAVAGSLGLGQAASSQLPGIVGEARLLLVIDSAEHVVNAVSRLSAGLAVRCPNVNVLVTSRRVLDVDGEVIWSVPPLRLPPDDAATAPAELPAYDAVELFSVRAAERHTGFRLTAQNADLVTTICRRLDGIPLALELAAARVRSLGLLELARRLDDASLLSAEGSPTAVERHRTMRATVDWSHRLLDEPEQTLFRRLAVFVGTFDLAAVETICPGAELHPEDVAGLVHRLVDRSLVEPVPSPGGGLRYRLMDAIRQYAQERLDTAGEAWVRARHARCYADLVRGLAAGGETLPDRPERMKADYGNVRRALDWSSENDPGLEASMVDRLRWFWLMRGSTDEPRARIRSVLRKEPHSAVLRASLLADAANWSRRNGDLELAMTEIEEASRLVGEVEDAHLVTRILQHRAIIHCQSGNVAAARENQNRAIEMLGARRPGVSMVTAMNNLAYIQIVSGHPLEALESVGRALEVLVNVHVSGPFTSLLTCHAHGAALLALDRSDEARAQFLCGLELAVQHDSQAAAGAFLEGLGCVAAAVGQPARCLQLLAAARRSATMTGGELAHPAVPRAASERTSRAALGAAAGDAWERGLRTTMREALQLAREGGRTPAGPALSPRKHEIVRLVAAGFTDKEIGRQLGISVRTVSGHLDELRRRLGFHNRAQLAAWATSAGLLT
jgi:non-specific serine/threonine protein kinase